MILANVVTGAVLAVVLILGNCSEQEALGELPVEFVTEAEKFTPQEPVRMEKGYDAAGQAIVILQMAAKDRAEFGKFTARHIGEAVELRVCDKAMTAPVVQEAITGGSVVVSGAEASGRMAEFMVNGCP